MYTEEKLKRLREKAKELETLGGIQALLDWDQQVYLPAGAAEDRANHMAVLGRILHEQLTSPESGQIIADLASEIGDLDADDEIAREVKVAKRSYDRMTKIPTEKMMEFYKTTTIAHWAWQKAREENDYASFEPHLSHIVALMREFSEAYAPYDHPYDPLLDQYEPGMKTADVKAIFSALRPRQVALLQAIAAAPQVENGFIKQHYPFEDQRRFGDYISRLMGYNFNQGRVDLAAHPFTTSFGHHDVRITTRFLKDDGMSALFSTMHETGHALYDQGIGQRYHGTSLGSAASLGTHESQSRLWENLVGRSRDFWQFCYPIMQMLFPEYLGNVSLEQFYRGINQVKPSPIRVEADEATYNLHIMLRLELEIGLIEGSLSTKDLPELWNSRMQEYLGITPDSDSSGVLQDVHWSGGMIGYFPTYALGNLISAQLWAKMNQDHPEIPQEMRSGQLGTILGWLRENIHQHGSRYDSLDLVQRVTGEPLNPDYYMNYLTQKYSDIYQL